VQFAGDADEVTYYFRTLPHRRLSLQDLFHRPKDDLVETPRHGHHIRRHFQFVLLGPSARAQFFRLDGLEDGHVEKCKLGGQHIGVYLHKRTVLDANLIYCASSSLPTCEIWSTSGLGECSRLLELSRHNMADKQDRALAGKRQTYFRFRTTPLALTWLIRNFRIFHFGYHSAVKFRCKATQRSETNK